MDLLDFYSQQNQTPKRRYNLWATKGFEAVQSDMQTQKLRREKLFQLL